MREIRSYSGNVNSEFPENIRPSHQESWQYPKRPVGGTKVRSVIRVKSFKYSTCCDPRKVIFGEKLGYMLEHLCI